MATISIDYDSNGDVELILEHKDVTHLNQTTQQPSPSSEQERLVEQRKYNVGPLVVNAKEVRLRVSALKLASSSSYFQAMLESSTFLEGRELKENGFVQIKLLGPEDDPTAMIIILGIIYENNVEVPTEMDISMMETVAVLIDKYQWHALAAPRATSWYYGLLNSQSGLPDGSNPKILTWLWLAWLFGVKDHFKSLSRVVQQTICNSISLEDENIRLSGKIIEAINEQRMVAFQKVEQALNAFITYLLNIKKLAGDDLNRMVGCLVLGSATYYAQDLKLGAFAVPDYASTSIRSLCDHTASTQPLDKYYVESPDGTKHHVVKDGNWDLKHKMQKAIEDLKMDEWGLDYDDFKPVHVNNRVRSAMAPP